jgi:hypothetical protein
LPPDAPMATFSPRWKSALAVMVWWISVSKTRMKHVLQSFEWSLGRRIRARFVLHTAQGEGAMAGEWRVAVAELEGQRELFLLAGAGIAL